MVTRPSGKARVCKTLIHQFKSGRHLQKNPGSFGFRDFCFALSPAVGKACDCSKHPYKTLLLLWTFEQLELFSLSTFIPSCSRWTTRAKSTVFVRLAFLVVQNPSAFWTTRDTTYIRHLFFSRLKSRRKLRFSAHYFLVVQNPLCIIGDFWTVALAGKWDDLKCAPLCSAHIQLN